jgi:glucose-6-phosphate 1-dehydrogenase
MLENRTLAPTILIFGASGDLTHRKLIPALYNLFRKSRLSEKTRIVGFARRPWDDKKFRTGLYKAVQEFSPDTFSEDVWERFATLLFYFQGDLNQVNDFHKLGEYLTTLNTRSEDRLYYLAISPDYYPVVVQHLGDAGMADQNGSQRNIVIEKPFGRDLESGQHLNEVLHKVFDESQIYRIDHYLGKETAQNILFFRFANTIFEPIWNRRYVDHVQITVSETVDIEHRADFYDETGVLRDMFQNHLLQLFTLITMEPPVSFEANALRNEKVKVLSATRPINISQSVMGQYRGYKETAGVKPGSRTPTFAAIQVMVDNWRWQGVPFYLRSGKALKKKTSEITVVFQSPPHIMFNFPHDQELTPNILSICIQPDEGIHLKFETKLPDSGQETRSVDMEFHYRDSFGNGPLPDAYERLLLDALYGDATLFSRSDEIEQAWKLIDPVIHAWDTHPDLTPCDYEPGSWGPPEADELLARNWREWRLGCGMHTIKGEAEP